MSEKPATPEPEPVPRAVRRRNIGKARKAEAKRQISRIVTMRDTKPSAREWATIRRVRGV